MLATRRTRQLRACGSSLASEILFFGVLFLAWSYCRHRNSAGFDTGARQTAIAIGTINTAILLCSSFVYSAGVGYLRAANNRRMIECNNRKRLKLVMFANCARLAQLILRSGVLFGGYASSRGIAGRENSLNRAKSRIVRNDAR
jgi:hypothetical protein